MYGVRGITYDWLSNYLRNRRQYVKVDDHSSSLLDVTCGAPQGSVLVPHYYIISSTGMFPVGTPAVRH